MGESSAGKSADVMPTKLNSLQRSFACLSSCIRGDQLITPAIRFKIRVSKRSAPGLDVATLSFHR
jgi:hypothetical protein